MLDTAPGGKGGGPSPLVNAFSNPTLGSLRYNTSQAGSPIFVCYGTHRVAVNLLEYWNFQGASSSGGGSPGGKGLGGSSGKKGANQQYSVDVAFGICQGPVSFTGSSYGSAGNNRIWANGGIAYGLGNAGLNGYPGSDGQAADPIFASSDANQPVIGYSGTCYVTGTPLNLGSSSAIPDISFEITGFESGSGGTSFPNDARPDLIVADMLTNLRYGAGFPASNLDTAGALADWGAYCQAAQLAMSLLLDKQQPTARWIEEIAQLTVSAVVWSGTLLKIIPYGDQALAANGASWAPHLTWQYNLGDDDFLPWSDGAGASDPVLLTRADPAQATNWLSIEYMDAVNSYNPQIIAAFDQGAIDQYGLRSEPSVQAHGFTNPTSATISAQLMLQRRLYLRNTYKFKLGWRYALLEPMDIVLITDATLGLVAAPVRITQIEEDDNGGLTITAEEIPGVTP
ncbi:MAG: phage tail protein [Alphaproteobacteria bacterium]|nr:phage tail protein [Alphaproteobacteria bacterium]